MHASSIEKVMNKLRKKTSQYEKLPDAMYIALLGKDTDPIAFCHVLNGRACLETQIIACALSWCAVNHRDKLEEFVQTFSNKHRLTLSLRMSKHILTELHVLEDIKRYISGTKKTLEDSAVCHIAGDSRSMGVFKTPVLSNRIKSKASLTRIWNKAAGKEYKVAFINTSAWVAGATNQVPSVDPKGTTPDYYPYVGFHASDHSHWHQEGKIAIHLVYNQINNVLVPHTYEYQNGKMVPINLGLKPIKCERVVVTGYDRHQCTAPGYERMDTEEFIKDEECKAFASKSKEA